MFRFGYDKFDEGAWQIVEPNGLIGQDKEPEVFRLYLPPWYDEIFGRYGIPFKIQSSKSLINAFGEYGNEDNKWIYLLEPNGDPRGWFGQYVEEDGDVNPIKSLLDGVDKKTLQSCRDGKTLICLYQPNEGFPTNWLWFNIFEEIYIELGKHNINPTNFMFVCGNMKLEGDFKEWKKHKDNKHKDSGDIHVCGFNNERFIDFHSKWKLAQVNHDVKRDKHFLCFNRELRPHRKLLLTMLSQENLLDKGMVSSKKFDKETFFRVPKEMFIGKGMARQLEKEADKLVEMTPLVVDVDEWDTNHFDTSPVWAYDKIYFSVVTNTWYDMDTQFLDEKVWKVSRLDKRRAKLILISAPYTKKTVEVDGLRNSPILDSPLDVQIVSHRESEYLLLVPFTLQTVEAKSPKNWDGNVIKALRYGNDTFFIWD